MASREALCTVYKGVRIDFYRVQLSLQSIHLACTFITTIIIIVIVITKKLYD